MENRINSIFELENGEKYLVLNQAIYQNRNYYLVAKVTDDENDTTGDIKFCEETTENGVLAIKLVKDAKIIELLAKYFQPND